MNALIGYYAGDEWGSDGWWEEGSDSAELAANAAKLARDSGFETAPDLVEVETSKLAALSDREWDDLRFQWRSARRNNWTSAAVDAAIEAEQNRRDEI